MDSFLDLPRSAPQPYNPENLFARPVQNISDASMLLENAAPNYNNVIRKSDEHMSYNAWKYKNNNAEVQSTGNKENFNYKPATSSSMLRKQVRFESPVQQYNYNNSPQQSPQIESHNSTNNSDCCANNVFLPAKNLQKFEDVYMANIPNRKLDLSIIESPTVEKVAKSTKITTDNSNDNLCMFVRKKAVLTEPVYDILNYNSQNLSERGDFPEKTTENVTKSKYSEFSQRFSHNTSNNENIPRCEVGKEIVKSRDNSEDPTVKDLLKIIQQQNEQLLILQKQVATLIDNQNYQKTVDNGVKQKAIESQGAAKTTNFVPNQNPQIQETLPNLFEGKKPSGVPNKFAVIDVMTSFEVSIRQPGQNATGKNQFLGRNFGNYGNFQESKIQEIFEDNVQNTQNTQMTNKNEMSLMLTEPVNIQEGRLSPESSIHVDMVDYSSDSDDESTDSGSDLGWTIYNNVMGQVNNLLTKAQSEKTTERQQQTSDKLRNKTMKKVKEATLKHLQTIGVNIPHNRVNDGPDSLRCENSTTNSEYDQNEISFAVKQLLMKYLPSEQLAKLQTNLPANKPIQTAQITKTIPRRPDFSFATVQYMKKYNLLDSMSGNSEQMSELPTTNQNRPHNPQIIAEKQQNHQFGPQNQQIRPQNKINQLPKFLDITALKQQPKLL